MRVVRARVGGGLAVGEAERPSAGPNQVLVRVVYGGICGSDLHYAAHGQNGIYRMTDDLVLGHEIVGVVAEVGTDLDHEVVPGEPVAIHPAVPTPSPGGVAGIGLHLSQGGSYLGSASTNPHTQGGYAEYLVVNSDQIRRLPAGLPLRRAALAEPLAVALHGVNQAAGLFEGKKVLVAGSGPIGSLVVAVLRARGAGSITVVDVVARPLETASAVGADETIQLGAGPDPDPDSFDVVIESSGSPRSLSSALRWVKRGGVVVQLGMLPAGAISVELASLVSKEVQLRGSQRFDVELDEALQLLAEHTSFDSVVSHVFEADQAEEAFAVAANSGESSKVLLQFGPTDA